VILWICVLLFNQSHIFQFDRPLYWQCSYTLYVYYVFQHVLSSGVWGRLSLRQCAKTVHGKNSSKLKLDLFVFILNSLVLFCHLHKRGNAFILQSIKQFCEFLKDIFTSASWLCCDLDNAVFCINTYNNDAGVSLEVTVCRKTYVTSDAIVCFLWHCCITAPVILVYSVMVFLN